MSEIHNGFYGIENTDLLCAGDPDNSNGSEINPWVARPYQNEIYKILFKNSKITCVTGGGKSFMINGKAKLEAKKDQKQIICVPKKIIGNGFVVNQWVKFSRNKLNFNILHDLCVDDSAAELNSKVEELIAFMKKPIRQIPDPDERIYLVTHTTFAKAINRLKADGKLGYYFKNITVHIDEAHRVHLDENGNETVYNQLGKAIEYIIKHPEKNIYFNLVTATFYRNNSESIVPADFKWNKRNTINVNTVTFLEYCKYLTGFNYSLRLEEGEFIDGIKKVFDNDATRPTIIFLPTENSTASILGMNKTQVVEAVKRAINSNGRNLRIVSLVDQRRRKAAMDEIRTEGNNIDVIINIKVASEGFDWPICKRVIICGKRDSLIEIPQNIGRVMRDHESKENNVPEIIHILPKVNPDVDDEGALRGVFNNVMKLIGGQLLLISDLYSKDANRLHRIAGRNQTINEYFGENLTVDERDKLNQAIRERMIDILQIKGEDEANDDDVRKIIKEELEERNLDSSDAVVNFLLRQKKMETMHSANDDTPESTRTREIERQFRRKLQGNNVDDAEIDLLLSEVDSFGWIKNYTTKIFNVPTFRELEERLNSSIIEKLKAIRDQELRRLEEANEN